MVNFGNTAFFFEKTTTMGHFVLLTRDNCSVALLFFHLPSPRLPSINSIRSFSLTRLAHHPPPSSPPRRPECATLFSLYLLLTHLFLAYSPGLARPRSSSAPLPGAAAPDQLPLQGSGDLTPCGESEGASADLIEASSWFL